MTTFLINRLKSYTHSENVVNLDFRTSYLPNDLDVNDIDFANTRGSVRLCNHHVLTPAEENKMLEEILAFNFGKY